MRKMLLLAGAAAVLLGSPAVAASSCIRHDDIRNWTAINDKTIVLENLRHQKFLMKLIGTCSDFKFHEDLQIRSRDALAISCVEPGDTVVTRTSGFRGLCTITSVTPYTGDPHHDGDHDSDRHGHDSY
jgi:hypothetical protein